MPIEPLLIIELALLGLATGFLAGLLGIGGGMIMVPFISAILAARGVAPGLSVKMAKPGRWWSTKWRSVTSAFATTTRHSR